LKLHQQSHNDQQQWQHDRW